MLLILCLSIASLKGQVETITEYQNPMANGKLKLQVRNDTLKYACESIDVFDGIANYCDTNPFIDYKYFIKRNVINTSWLNDVLRVYDYWIDVPDAGAKGTWLNYEKAMTVAYKEDYTDSKQTTGITYKHHESRKSTIGYTLANPSAKAYHDDTKYQFQYDWEENIKGRFESFFLDGTKKFRHNYEINRIMALDKGFAGNKKSSIDAQIIGTIQSYHPNGKKKAIVTYTDRFVAEKTAEDEKRKMVKTSRTGEKLSYRENGRLFCKGNFNIHGANGKLEYYGPKGVIVVKVENYKDGKLNGKYTEYYLDGTLKAKGEYKEGKVVGEIQRFNEDGSKVKG